MDDMDDMDSMDERIRQRIGQLERERDEFAVAAPVRADERLQAVKEQLQMQIEMRMAHYQEQIDTLKALLAEPAKEGD